MTIQHMHDFDAEHGQALRELWFLGDVHASFLHIPKALLAAVQLPKWLVFLGDIEIDHTSFREILAPLKTHFPSVQVAFIHGNHDCDTLDHWTCLHDCGDAIPLHGTVTEINGIRIAGLGGVFMGRVWYPPDPPKFDSKEAAINRGAFQIRGGQRPNSAYLGAIYPEDFDRLVRLRADVLVTHEAPGSHPMGFVALDALATSMRVKRSFHGHHHDDMTDEYRKSKGTRGYDCIGVNYCSIRNGLGELILQGESGW